MLRPSTINIDSMIFPALPPDVRCRLRPTEEIAGFNWGYAPQIPGRSPENIQSECRKVRDLPHIGRHSR